QTLTISGGPFFVGDFSANRVRIGTALAQVISATTNQLSVLVPYGAETGRLSVMTPNGERTTNNAVQVATTVSGVVQSTERQPLAGVTVRSVGSNDQATTRADGSFVLPITSNPSANVFLVTLQFSPQNVSGYQNFGTLTRRFEVSSKRDNRLSAPLFLQVPNGSAGNLGGGELFLTVNVFGCTTDNTGVGLGSFRLEAGATATNPDGSAVNRLTLAQVQDCRAPQRLPAGLFSSRILQVSPLNARIAPGGQLSFPNADNLAPGTQFRMFRLDQQGDGGTGEFQPVVNATVSADRSRIETAARAITEGGIYFAAIAPQNLTTVTGRVVELGSNNAEVASVGAQVHARGQVAFTDGDGAFVLRNVPVNSANDSFVIEASQARTDGTNDAVQRVLTSAVIRPGGMTVVTPALLLRSFSAGNNRAPVANSQTVTTNEDTPRAITLGASDPDGNPLRYIYTQPANGVLSGAAPHLLYTPNANFNGADNFTFRVSDGKAESGNAVVAITVNQVNDQPVLTVPGPQTVRENEQLSFTISVTDADVGQTVTLNANNLPAGANFLASERRFVWTPSCTQAGTYTVTFVAIDNGTPVPLSDVKSVVITVTDQNCAPSLVLPAPPTVNEGQNLNFTVRAVDPDPGQVVTLSAGNLPSGSTFNAATGVFDWTPSCTQSGGYQVTFTATDNGSPVRSETRQLAIVVNNVTVLPTFTTPAAVSVTEGQQVQFTLLATVGCPNQNLSISGVNLPVGASLSPPAVSSNQVSRQFTWTPNFGQSGEYALEFFVQDGNDQNSIVRRTVRITVLDFNRDPEFIVPGVRTIPVAQLFTLALTATDPDPQVVTLPATGLPEGATFTGTPGNPATGTFAWTPAFNQIANFTVNFIATDNGSPARSVTRSLLIVVSGDCDPNLTVPNNQTVVELLPLTFTVLGSPKCPGQTVTLGANNLPPRATFNASTGVFAWTPILGEVGTYTVNFTATDNNNPPRVVTRAVQISVTGNRAPIATALSITLDEDVVTPVVLQGTDPEGVAVTYTVVTPPQHGTLSGTAPNLTYTPVANYNGNDSFTYRVSDGSLTSAPATVTITVNPVNDLPVANNQNIAISEDAAANITLAATDVDGDALTYSITQQPVNGSLSGTPPNVTYTPNLNFFGTDEFRFRANDGKGNSNEAIISITVTQVNDPPSINVPGPQNFSAGQTVTFAVTGSDVDQGQTLTFSANPLPSGAGFNQTAPTAAQFSWTPSEVQAGTYTINFTVADSGAPQLTATKSVTITINPTTTTVSFTAPNEVTVAENQNVSFNVTAAGGTVGASWTLMASNLPSGASFPTLSGTGDNITQTFSWTPGFTQAGTYDVTFTATRGAGTGSRTVRVNVTNVCRPPVMANLTSPISVTEGQPVVVNISATDPDTNETLSLTSSNLPAGATFPPTTGTNGTVSQQLNWTPAFNQQGTYVVTFIVSDDCLPTPLTDSRQLTIVVGDANRLPVATNRTGNDRVTMTEDTNVPITLSATDEDGDVLTYTIVTPPAHGTFTGTAPNLTFMPAANYNGADSFTFKANDGKGDSNIATVEIAIAAVCDPPVLTVPGPQSATLTFSADCATQTTAPPLTFDVSATDPDTGDLITLTAQNLPPGATFTQTNNTGTFSWTPSVFTEAGSFTVTFRATDNCSTVQTASSPVVINFTIPASPLRWVTTGIAKVGTNVTLLREGSNLYAGMIGGGIFLTNNNGLTWPRVDAMGLNSTDIRGFVSKTATVGANTVTTLFVGTAGGGVYRSINNGVDWMQVNNGLVSVFIRTLTVASDGTVFAGTQNGVFYTTNDGTSWTALNNGLADQSVSALFVAGSGANARLFAGTDNGAVFSLLVADISSAGGVSWVATGSGLPTSAVTNFEVNTAGSMLYASFNGAGVYRLTLGGTSFGSWEGLTFGLPSNFVRDLLNVGNRIYAATDGGVTRFDDATSIWSPVNECIPSLQINSLATNATGSKLFAGSTDGRVYIRPL
ncbi:MAG: tandem-95 repeat protein, partial [Acidobacteria bacterium]|nr:tandem-95 repeat protein [Acidobacteriota bacterium]